MKITKSTFWGQNIEGVTSQFLGGQANFSGSGGIPPVSPPALEEPCRCYKVKEKFNYDMKERVHLAYQGATSKGFSLVIFYLF